MSQHYAQHREARLLPVVCTIFACYVCIVIGAYLVAQLM